MSHAEVADPLAHRHLLDGPPEYRPFAGTGLFARVGGQATVDRLVDLLYDGFETDPALRPLFGRDLTQDRANQKVFFAQWLGGSHRYAEQSYSGLAQPGAPQPGAKRRSGQPRRRRTVASCGVAARVVTRGADLARRGDTAGLEAALDEAPGLLEITFAARLMLAGALAGKAGALQLLIQRGASVNAPHCLPVAVSGRSYERVIFVTPLCAARLRHRAAAEHVLLRAGAREDIFTAAFLGELTRLRTLLAGDAALAQACDPAADVLDITPVDHAVAGGQAEALRLLLGHVRPPLERAARALRGAVERGDVAMAEMLLAHGADAARIGVGRWVLHPELAPLLASRGASVGSSGAWIGACCTGNQGRKDDPDYVRALLRHGARADDRRTGAYAQATGVAALAATALHYAAKAGFAQTVEVLLQHGADPSAHDSRGRTPLDWLEECPPSAAREEVRHLLTRGMFAGRGVPGANGLC